MKRSRRKLNIDNDDTTNNNGNPGLPGTSEHNVVVFHGADGKDGASGKNGSDGASGPNGNVHPHDEPNVPHIPWPEPYHNNTGSSGKEEPVKEQPVEEQHANAVDDEEVEEEDLVEQAEKNKSSLKL